MKYIAEQRLSIGREIYSKAITVYEAATKYDINLYTARDYMRLYRDKNGLPVSTDENSEIKKRIHKPKTRLTHWSMFCIFFFQSQWTTAII